MNQSTNEFLESRQPSFMRRLLFLLWSAYGISWAVITMIPICIAAYLIFQLVSNVNLFRWSDVLERLWQPAAMYAPLVVVHLLNHVLFKHSPFLLLCVLSMLIEITMNVAYVAFFWELWVGVVDTLMMALLSIL